MALRIWVSGFPDGRGSGSSGCTRPAARKMRIPSIYNLNLNREIHPALAGRKRVRKRVTLPTNPFSTSNIQRGGGVDLAYVKWQDSAPNFKRNSASLPSSSPATPLRPGSLSTQGADSTVESSQVSTLGSGFRKAPFRTFHVRTDAHKSYLRKPCNAFPPTCLQKRRSRSLCSRMYSLTNLR